jgi:hypothetical protein
MASNTKGDTEKITGGAGEKPAAYQPAGGHQIAASGSKSPDSAGLEAPSTDVAVGPPEQTTADTRSPPLVVTPCESRAQPSSAEETAREGAGPRGIVPAASADTAATLAALRAENERLRAELGSFQHRAQRRTTSHPKRRALVGTLAVLTCLGLLLSTLTLWSQQTFLNNEARWAAIVGPVGQDPMVVNAVSAYVSDQVLTVLQVRQRAQNALPDQARFLAIPITDVVRQFTQKGVTRAMETEQFQQVWIEVNSAVHTEVVAALRGQSEKITISGSVVTLNLLPIITQGLHTIRGQIEGILPAQVALPDPASTEQVQQGIQRLSQALGVQLPPNFGQVTLFQSDQLATAQQIVRLVDIFAVLLPLLTLALLIATLWLSLDRRRTLVQLGIGIAITFALAKIGIAVLEQNVESSIANPTARDIIDPVIARALSYLVTSTTWLLVMGLVVALVAFLVGKPEWFRVGYVKTRQAYAAASGWAQRQFGSGEHGHTAMD